MNEVEKQLTLSWVGSSYRKGFLKGFVSGVGFILVILFLIGL